MTIKTERFNIVLLTPEQLELWINNIPQLEEELKCSYQAEPMGGMFQKIVAGQLKITQKDKEHYMWHSFWLIIRMSDRVVVGSADFKSIPDDKGQVEIGYGLGKDFEHNGYMTETVHAMCNWAMKQDGVKHIIAETELNGLASQRILQRCGFIEYSRDITVWWRL